MSSYFPSTISLKLRTVSSIFTYFPSRPVNCAATNMGCERNFSILRARATVRLSSSESSSMPRIEELSDEDKRSEEHTSELQSHHDLVCRLLLEKKKKKK